MTNPTWTRRTLLASAAAGGFVAAAEGAAPAKADEKRPPSFLYALNTSTISGRKPTIVEAMEIAAKAGYDGIEPWIREVEAHVRAGGTIEEVGQRARDLNLKVVDAIGFAEWAVDDDARRAKGLETARRDMEMVAKLGGTRIAAPAAGAADASGPKLDLGRLAERYRALLELGKTFGVTPIVEVWGFSRNLTTLAEAAHVALAADHPDAAILADVYHLHKGGSGFNGLKLLGPGAVPVLHMNDYPDRPRANLNDSDRVFPGAGVAPLGPILRSLHHPSAPVALSLELFNKDYWKLDPAAVAAEGLARMKAAVAAALG